MLRSSIPTRFLLAWAANAAGAFIRTVPVASQIGLQDGAASYNDGFVPDNFAPLAGGGVPPFGQDFNGVLNEMTTWDQWYQAGAYIPYDATFATPVGGYPRGAILDSAILVGAQWYSTVDSNLTDPDDPLTSSGWARAGIPAGVPLQFLTSALPPGFVAMNGLTIGSASSNAGYASADALFLFAANWLSFSNSQCPILTSAGAASTRGANPVADFNADKQLTLPNGKGLGLIGVDTMGGAGSSFLSGVPVTIGNTTTPGSIIGENLHVLSSGENAAHTHANSLSDPGHFHLNNITQAQFNLSAGSVGPFLFGASIGGGASSSLIQSIATGVSINNASSGSGAGHNTVERNMGVYWGQKL